MRNRSRTSPRPAESPRGSAIRRVATSVTLAGLVAVTVAGCMSMTTNLTLDAQGRADGFLEVAVDKQAASMLGISSLDGFEDQMTSDLDDDVATSLIADAALDFSETDTSYVLKADMNDVPLTEQDFKAGVDGEQVYFHFANAGDDSGMDIDMGNLVVEVTFPGDLTEVSGAEKVDSDTIRYTGSFSDAVVIDARSDIAPAPIALYVGIGVAALLGIGGVVAGLVVLARRKQSSVPAGLPGTGYGQYPQPGQQPLPQHVSYAGAAFGAQPVQRHGQPQAPVQQVPFYPAPPQPQQPPAASPYQG